MRAERREPGRLAFLSISGLAIGLGACGPGEPDLRPPVVLVVVDTLRADAVLDRGGANASPAIDALAADGVLFSRAFSHAPMTLPSHTALFSSRPPFETGVLNNWQPVREELPLLAEWLGRFGYQTRAVIGLGTLDPQPGAGGLDRGFDEYDVEFWNMAAAPDVIARARSSLAAIDSDRPFFFFVHFSDPHAPYNAHGLVVREAELLVDGEVAGVVETTSLDPLVVELELEPGRHVFEVRSEDDFRIRAFQVLEENRKLAVEWTEAGLREQTDHAVAEVEIEEARSYRLRLWVNDALNRRDSRRRYGREVEFVDGFVGELIAELKARGLYERSLVVFTSDHGEALGERGLVGHVQNLHDELIHVPLVVKPPLGHVETGRLQARSDALVPQADLVPTVLELIGLPPLPEQRGVSVLDDHPRVVIAQTHKPESKRDLVCLRDERYKLILDPETGEFRMYDMVADPGEKADVFEEKRGEREEWVGQLEAIARVVAEGGLGEGVQDPDVMERLRALGYF